MKRSPITVRVLMRFMAMCIAISIAVAPAHAQVRRDAPPSSTSSPQDRLSPATRTAVNHLVDSLAAEHLPADALRDKVAEGVLKGADDNRILLAVRSLASRLREGRLLLGPAAKDDELKAAASALFTGVEPVDILRLVNAQRKRDATSSLTVPLTVVAGLASQRVPPSVAVSSVESLMQRSARDADLSAFRLAIERDIRQGRTPGEAVNAGMRSTLKSLNPPM